MSMVSARLDRRLRQAGDALYHLVRSALPGSRTDLLTFHCNICGRKQRFAKPELTREARSCNSCGSSVRLRAIVHLLAKELFGESMLLKDFPVAKQFKGFGLSDWEVYGDQLAKKFDYTNTYYHTEPRLDICDVDPSLHGTLDFLISTDVFEHVPQPVSIAFENAYKLLKPGGLFIFSVPYNKNATTVEHFPELHDFKLEQEGESYVLHNTTKTGAKQEFRDLVFHGGAGSTLEMRVFGDQDLHEHFAKAGFDKPVVFQEDVDQFGIHWPEDWSLPWVARKPG